MAGKVARRGTTRLNTGRGRFAERDSMECVAGEKEPGLCAEAA